MESETLETKKKRSHSLYEHSQLIESHEDDSIRFSVLEEIGYGGEARIDEVKVEGPFRGSPLVCVRRSFRVRTRKELKTAKAGLSQEVGILAKLRRQRHFIDLLGSYTRGLELGLLHQPRADFDLAFVLSRTSDERQELLPDRELQKGMGCLASALYFLHENKIRHKDICPANILVDGSQMLFADFGLSLDFSEMTNSETTGAVGQRKSYRPPECFDGKKHSCASDVFSLGCVFLETLRALAKPEPPDEDDASLPTPYRENLRSVQHWLEGAKDSSQGENTVRIFWLDVTRRMLAKDAHRRPRMSNIVYKFKERYSEGPNAFLGAACQGCLDANILQSNEKRLDKLRNADFVWESDASVLLGREQPDLEDELKPNDGILKEIARGLADMFSELSGPRRWYLTLYLDNGHSLKEYGTEETDVNLSFDFGELLVDRVVFDSGTYGKAVSLYEQENCKRKHFDSRRCDKRFPQGRLVRSYRVSAS